MNTHYGPSGETWKLEKTSRIVAHHVTWPYFSTVSRFKHILIFAYICTSFHRNKDQIRTRNKFRFYMNFQLAISIDPFISLKASVTSEYKNFSYGRYLNSAIGGCFCVVCFLRTCAYYNIPGIIRMFLWFSPQPYALIRSDPLLVFQYNSEYRVRSFSVHQ